MITEFACPDCGGESFRIAHDPEPDMLDRFMEKSGPADRLVVMCGSCREFVADARDVLSSLIALRSCGLSAD